MIGNCQSDTVSCVVTSQCCQFSNTKLSVNSSSAQQLLKEVKLLILKYQKEQNLATDHFRSLDLFKDLKIGKATQVDAKIDALQRKTSVIRNKNNLEENV